MLTLALPGPAASAGGDDAGDTEPVYTAHLMAGHSTHVRPDRSFPSGDWGAPHTPDPHALVHNLANEERAAEIRATPVAQVECVAWFDGSFLLPDRSGFDNAYDYFAANDPNATAREDCTAFKDGDLDGLGLHTDLALVTGRLPGDNATGRYVLLVEEGDCDPRTGTDFQELDVFDFRDRTGMDHTVRSFLYTCAEAELPLTEPATERVWVTVAHDRTLRDPLTVADQPGAYDFAMLVDTCSGMNVYENETWTPGSPLYHYDLCTDGRHLSFDDTRRGALYHGDAGGRTTTGIEAGDSVSPARDQHRDTCRWRQIEWPTVSAPQDVVHDPYFNCREESHATARADVYVVDSDPTGLFPGP